MTPSGLNGTPRAVIEKLVPDIHRRLSTRPAYRGQCGLRQVILGTFPPLFAATQFTVCWLHRMGKCKARDQCLNSNQFL